MSLYSELRNIWRLIDGHPLSRHRRWRACGRFLRWQMVTRLWDDPVAVRFVDHTRLLMRRGMQGATANVYVGLAEFHDMAFVLHLLREEDRMGDIGANVGVYTVLAAGVRGSRTVAVEPTPESMAWLEANLRLNDIVALVRAVPMGVSDRPGTLRFLPGAEPTTRVCAAADGAGVERAVTTLDALFADGAPTVLKIDVEGYEAAVLAGGSATLSDPALKAVIVELNGQGRPYGFQDQDVHGRLSAAGFQPCTYDAPTRTLRPDGRVGTRGNTLYVRDLPFAQARVRSAPPFEVFGTKL